ncbi:MAG: HupE/UreJ family protein [Pseudomonadota bacterium]
MRYVRWILVLFWCCAGQVQAHALDPGYLDLRQIDGTVWNVYWRSPDVQGAPMAIAPRLPDDCAPNAAPAPRFDGMAWVSQWVMSCPGGLRGQEIHIDGLDAQVTDVLLRVSASETAPITERLTPLQPSVVIPQIPSLWGVFVSYGVLGIDHILGGWDHLLFVLALILLIPDMRRLIGAITAFTVAHSITLALAALGHLSVPGPPVEAIIALSIVFLAIELLKRRPGEQRLSQRAPWMIAFGFGLLHGLGFAGALREIGLPEADIAMALLAFNLGVEAGQLAFVCVVLILGALGQALIARLRPIGPSLQGATSVVTGYAIGAVATFWLAERLAGF